MATNQEDGQFMLVKFIDERQQDAEEPDVLGTIEAEQIPIPGVGDSVTMASIHADFDENPDWDLSQQEEIPALTGEVVSRHFFYSEIGLKAEGERGEQTKLSVTICLDVPKEIQDQID